MTASSSPIARPHLLPPPRRRRVVLVAAVVALLAGCGGGGSDGTASGGGTGGGGTGGGTPLTSVVISGKATYESVPPKASGALDYAAASDKPIRGATVQLLDASGAVLATTTTSATGDYRLDLATAQAVTVRVRAELKRTGTSSGDRDISVLDNTSGDALYTLDSASFTPTAAATTQNLRAASGWGGSSYTGARAAGPFAVLDALYAASAKIESVASVNLPPLRIFWSVNNRPVDGDPSTGAIGTSFYQGDPSGRMLYLLGAANTDSDEYDSHVVVHEFGHYLQDALSRDDSPGGVHGGADKLDLRVAFSEGWGNAWSGIALGGPVYADSYGAAQASGFTVDVSVAASGSDRGAYSEDTAQYLVWSANAAVGFAPLYNALLRMADSPAFTTLYAFAQQMKAAGANATTITALWATQLVVANDEFGTGETNAGGDAANLPVYRTHTAASGVAQTYCVRGENDPNAEGNKLGEFVYIRVPVASAGTHTLTVTRASATYAGTTDPDFVVLASTGASTIFDSSNADSESASLALPTGTHSLALSDYQLSGSNTSCFNLTVN